MKFRSFLKIRHLYIVLLLLTTMIIAISYKLCNPSLHLPLKYRNKNLSAHPDMPFRLTGQDKRLALDLLATFHLAAKRLRINYVLYGGTLLGAIRHQGFVPWDDDVDLLVADQENRNETQWNELISRIASVMGSNYSSFGKFVFHTKGNIEIENFKPVRWPMLDIFPIHDNGTHWGWDRFREGWSKADYVPYKMIYPLRQFPFENMLLPIPQKPLHFFNWHTDATSHYEVLNVCCQNYLNHKLWLNINQRICLYCEELAEHFAYPFVKMFNKTQGETVHVLMVKNTTLKSTPIDLDIF